MKITRIILPPDLIPAKQQAAEAIADRINPSVAVIWPSEYGRDHQLFKTPVGALGDAAPYARLKTCCCTLAVQILN